MILAISTRDLDPIGKLNFHRNDDIEKVILLNQFEYEYSSFGPVGDDTWNNFVATVNDIGVPLDIINGTHPSMKLFHDPTDPFYKNVENVYQWPTVFFLFTIHELFSIKFNISDWSNIPDQIDHTFISFNNKVHFHRLLMVDLLARENLIDDNLISWSNNDNFANYVPKYFDGNTRVIDDAWQINGEKFREFPASYKNCLFEVVNESSHEHLFLTEKTVCPLFLRKPFIVYGCVGYHTWLHDLGFELYTELFDYSFDSEKNIYTRYKKITENISRLNSLSREEQLKLYRSVEDKLEHNQQLALEYAVDIKHLPEIVCNLIENKENIIMYDEELPDKIYKLNEIQDFIFKSIGQQYL